MPGKKEASFIDEVVDGFSDLVDGSIFDFDDDTTEKDSDGRGNGTDGGANERVANENEGNEGRGKGKRATVPGRVEGVTITNTEKKGKTPGNEKPAEGNDGDGNGAG